ncbi:Hypothetical_protein [Hexamita inflata]|uniref:Hypothetical_protein n=1 Tax=Hexamita inflata TaxID=28002 RepID=A0ABP1JA44_9EUKA
MHLETRNSRLTQIEVLRNSKTQYNSECEVEDVKQAIYVIESAYGNYVIYSTRACRLPCFVTAITARRTQVLEDGLSLHAQQLPEDYIMQPISANGKHENSTMIMIIKTPEHHFILMCRHHGLVIRSNYLQQWAVINRYLRRFRRRPILVFLFEGQFQNSVQLEVVTAMCWRDSNHLRAQAAMRRNWILLRAWTAMLSHIIVVI